MTSMSITSQRGEAATDPPRHVHQLPCLGWTLAGTFAFGRRFRRFSLVLLIPMTVFGALTVIYPARASAGEPTTWLGIIERVSIYGYLLWIAVLSVALFRDRGGHSRDAPIGGS